MTQLTFTKEGDVYVTTATVSADYNIHLERNEKSFVTLLHSTVESGRKVFVHEWKEQDLGGPDFDEDFDGIVYPKYIKIISGTPVTLGYVKEND